MKLTCLVHHLSSVTSSHQGKNNDLQIPLVVFIVNDMLKLINYWVSFVCTISDYVAHRVTIVVFGLGLYACFGSAQYLKQF